MIRKTVFHATKLFVLGCCVAVFVPEYQSAAIAKPQIITFDPAGSIGTYPWQANEDGSIAGFWYDSSAKETKGFIRTPDGTITEFDHAGSKTTAAYDINGSGVSTGYWTVDEGNHPGFVPTPDGTMTEFRAPGDVSGTFPIAITEKGAITGSYYDLFSIPHGFLRSASGDFATFDVSGDTYGTSPMSLNKKGVIAGHWGDENGLVHGFVRAPDDSGERIPARRRHA